jgi:hypothetical protein
MIKLTKEKKYVVLIYKKTPNFMEVFRGPVQVRTGVAAFAELSLTTRPQDHFVNGF